MLAAGQAADRPAVQEYQQRVRAGTRRRSEEPFQVNPAMDPRDDANGCGISPAQALQWLIRTSRPGPDKPR